MQVIDSYGESRQIINHVDIIATSLEPWHRPGDLVIEETDTYQVLPKGDGYRPTGDNSLRILTEAFLGEPSPPGAVIHSGTHPARLRAVIYDFDRSPISRAEWLLTAWTGILEMARNTSAVRIRTPLLGQKEPALGITVRCEALYQAVMDLNPSPGMKIWLQAGRDEIRGWSRCVKGKP